MNIVMLLIAFVGGAIGVLSSFCCILGIPAVIIWKIIRAMKNGISVFD
jgi:hypothetical protein